MAKSPKKYLPAAELRRLTQGCYEQIIGQTLVVLQQHFEGKEVDLIATQCAYAVVIVEGTTYRVSLERSEEGKLSVEKAEPLAVELFTETSVQDFARREVAEIVSLFLSGVSSAAADRLESLTPLVANDMFCDQGQLVERVVSQQHQDRPWLRLYNARQHAIVKMAGSDIKSVDEVRLQPKFGKLYDGAVESDALQEHAAQVDEDLAVVRGRYRALLEVVQEAVASVSPDLFEGSDVDSSLTAYRGFARDLVEDLRQLRQAVQQATKRVTDIDKRGELYDRLTEGLYPREVAGRFVVAVANRLAATQ